MLRLPVFLCLFAASAFGSTKLKTNSKIAIIGAGPSGIHMASLLANAGFANVTIYEKSDRIGGKSWSVPDETQTHCSSGTNDCKKVFHETGTCYLHPAYFPIFSLLESYVGPDQVQAFPTYFKDAEGKGWRAFYDDTIGNETTGYMQDHYYPIAPWVGMKASPSVTRALVGGLLSYLEPAHQAVVSNTTTDDETKFKLLFAASIKKYIALHREHFGSYEGTIIPRPSQEALGAIDMTFLEYLTENDLVLLIPLMQYTQTAQGYGFPETVPALYGLWWHTPDFVASFASLGGDGPPLTSVVKDGYQNLWEKMAEFHAMNIVFNASIVSIKRSEEEVELGLGDTVLTYDHLIVAMPQKDLINSGVLDASDEERKWFGNQSRGLYVTTIVETGFSEYQTVGITNNLVPGKPLSLLGKRNSQASWFPETNANREEGKVEHVVTYQYVSDNDTIREEEALQKLKEGMADIGWDFKKKILQVSNPYFPRFTRDEITNGIPWDIQDWNLDNALNTWHIGSSVCMESVLDTTNYNTWLWNASGIQVATPGDGTGGSTGGGDDSNHGGTGDGGGAGDGDVASGAQSTSNRNTIFGLLGCLVVAVCWA